MKILRQDTAKTRKSLLMAASEIFAEKGYGDTTIAEISRRAGTNVAAVNYHFGDKETLYREAWRQSFIDSLKAHPPDGGIASTAPAEQRLKAQILALLHRITDQSNREFLIVYKELANPTGLLQEVMRKEVQPLLKRIESLVHDVLGPATSETQVRFCVIGIISQCIIPTFINRLEREEGGAEDASWKIEDIETYAEHVVRFSLAGMWAIRHSGEKSMGRQRAVLHSENSLKVQGPATKLV